MPGLEDINVDWFNGKSKIDIAGLNKVSLVTTSPKFTSKTERVKSLLGS